MKKIKTAKKTLKQVQKFLDNIPDIDRGGCGISALAMYRWLKNNGDKSNIKFVFLYEYGDEKEYLTNKRVLKDKEGEPVACSHCCILHGKKFIDSEGVVDIEEYEWVQIIKEEDFLKRSLANIGEWNPRFDRHNICKIEEELGIDLGDIKDDELEEMFGEGYY